MECAAFFHMLICHLCIFFGELSVKVFSQFLTELFVFLLLSFKCSFYILSNNPFSDVSFENIFTQSVAFRLFISPRVYVFNKIQGYKINYIRQLKNKKIF